MGMSKNILDDIEALTALKKAMDENQCFACSHEFIDIVNKFGTNIIDDAITALKNQNELEEKVKKYELEKSWDESPDRMSGCI